MDMRCPLELFETSSDPEIYNHCSCYRWSNKNVSTFIRKITGQWYIIVSQLQYVLASTPKSAF